jgi:small subunit ribosomal protein S9
MNARALLLRGLARRDLCRARRFPMRTLSTAKGAAVGDGDGLDSALELPDPSDPFANPLAALGDAEMSADQYYWRRRAAASPPRVYKRIVDEEGRAFATGKRKRSVARVWVRDGDGGVTVNGSNFVDVFHRVDHRDQILRPLTVTGNVGKFSVEGLVAGGGNMGQAEALRHGIAKALQAFDPRHRPALKKDGLLTRDSRVVESKKYGLKYVRLASRERRRCLVSQRVLTVCVLSLPIFGVEQEGKEGADLGQAVECT